VFICLIGVVEGYPILLACAAVAAIGHAAFHPVALSTVNRLCTSENSGRITSLFVTRGNLGYALGPLLTGIVIIVAGLPGLLFLVPPALPVAAALTRQSDRPHAEPGTTAPPNMTISRPVRMLLLASTLRAWSIFAVIAFIPPFLI
jgi:FSR family fosmidomycin resistance protein-like MFS transporter